MATIAGSLNAKMGVDLTKFKSGMKSADDAVVSTSKRMEKRFKRVAIAAGALTGAVLAIRKGLRVVKSLTDAYAVQEDALTSLSASLIATGRQGADAMDLLASKAAAIQAVTRTGDEALIAATGSVALLADKLSIPELAKAQESIVGIADVFLRGNVENAAQLLGKTLGSTTNALTRYGIQIDTSASQSEKLRQIVEQTSKFFEVSQARAENLTGRLAQLGNAWGDLKEQLGEAIAGSPAVTDFFKTVTDAVQNVTAVLAGGEAEKIKQAFALVGEASGAAFVGGFAASIRQLPEVFNQAVEAMFSFLPDFVRKALNFPGDKLRKALIGMIAPADLVTESFERAANALEKLNELAGQGVAPAKEFTSGVTAGADQVERAKLSMTALGERLVALLPPTEAVVQEWGRLPGVLKPATEQVEKQNVLVQEMLRNFDEIARTLSGRIANSVADIVLGFNSATQSIKKLAEAIIRDLIVAIVKAIVQAKVLNALLDLINAKSGFFRLVTSFANQIGSGPSGGPGQNPGPNDFAVGGIVPGSGPVPIMAHGGEGVLTARAVRGLGGPPALNLLNSGVIPSSSRPVVGTREPEPVINNTYHIGQLSFPNITNAEELKRELPEILADLARKGSVNFVPA